LVAYNKEEKITEWLVSDKGNGEASDDLCSTDTSVGHDTDMDTGHDKI